MTEEEMKGFGCRIIDMFEAENISPMDALVILQALETAIIGVPEVFSN